MWMAPALPVIAGQARFHVYRASLVRTSTDEPGEARAGAGESGVRGIGLAPRWSALDLSFLNLDRRENSVSV